MTTSPLKISQMITPEISNSELDFEVFKKKWQQVKKKMVLVGVNDPDNIDKEWLDLIDADPTVIMFTETTSNLRKPNAIN